MASLQAPPSPPAAPPPAPPHMPTRQQWSPAARRRTGFAALVAFAVLVAALVAANNDKTSVAGSGSVNGLADRAYAPQTDRNAEWAGSPNGPMSQSTIDKIARNDGIEILPKFAANFSIADHFSETRRLVATAKQYGNDLKVYDYFSAAFWFTQNDQQWGAYGRQFQTSWLFHGADGQPIPFYGVNTSAASGNAPVGYLIDLRNPDFRAWATRTIVSWMKSAPYAGIAFDSADPLLDSTLVRRSLGNGDARSYSALLCGTQAANCTAVQQWNTGLSDLLKSTTTALNAMGKQVLYNGIAPSGLRGTDRNIGLLADANATSNEAFCAQVTGTGVNWTSIQDDVALMKQIAAQHKKVVEITDYKQASPTRLGDYCAAGFLMGWQPGSSYYVFHAGYADSLTGGYPEVPEQNLQLGNPTAQATIRGNLLSRSFQHGFVAVNTGNAPVQVRVPIAGVRFANGSNAGRIAAGTTTTLAPHTAIYVLSDSYLNS